MPEGLLPGIHLEENSHTYIYMEQPTSKYTHTEMDIHSLLSSTSHPKPTHTLHTNIYTQTLYSIIHVISFLMAKSLVINLWLENHGSLKV